MPNIFELRENRRSEHHTLRMGVNENSPYLLQFLPMWIKFFTRDAHNHLVSRYEFCENWYNKIQTVHKVVNGFFFVLTTFIVQFRPNSL